MMWRPFDLLVASACCAIAFPVIGFKPERQRSWLPKPADPAKLAAERLKPGANWFHLQKDLFVNSVRADAEWWGKFGSFCLWSSILNCIFN